MEVFTPFKGIQDSPESGIARRGFRILATGFQSLPVERGFWISIVCGIPDSLSYIPDYKAQQNFPAFRIPEFGFPYVG